MTIVDRFSRGASPDARTAVLIQHHPSETLGSNFDSVLDGSGYSVVTLRIYDDALDSESFDAPSIGEIDVLISLGGPMSANDPYPAFAWEMKYLRAAAEAGVPVVSVCLGAQLLSRALGGAVSPTGGYQFGLRKLWVSEEGAEDSAFGKITAPLVPTLHGDSFTVPQGAAILAEGFVMRRDGRYVRINMAFRYENAYGVQFEPQLTPDHLRDWNTVFTSDYEMMGSEFDPEEEAMRNIREFAGFAPVHEAQMAAFFGEILGLSSKSSGVHREQL